VRTLNAEELLEVSGGDYADCFWGIAEPAAAQFYAEMACVFYSGMWELAPAFEFVYLATLDYATIYCAVAG
jgi:hypothetical protein